MPGDKWKAKGTGVLLSISEKPYGVKLEDNEEVMPMAALLAHMFNDGRNL